MAGWVSGRTKRRFSPLAAAGKAAMAFGEVGRAHRHHHCVRQHHRIPSFAADLQVGRKSPGSAEGLNILLDDGDRVLCRAVLLRLVALDGDKLKLLPQRDVVALFR